MGDRAGAERSETVFRIFKPSIDAQRVLVDVEDGFHLAAVVGLHLPQADDLAHDLGVVTLALGLRIDVADVVSDALFLFLKPLDAFDEQPQLIGGDNVAHVSPRKNEARP